MNTNFIKIKTIFFVSFILILIVNSKLLAQVNVPSSGGNFVSCNTTLYDGGGTGNYSSGWSGYTILAGRSGATININGSYTLEGCNCDYIYIRSGSGSGGAILATYTNGSGTVNYTGTAGQTLTVQFVTDGSVVASGFVFTITYSGTCPTNSILVNGSGINNVSCGTNTILSDHAGNSDYANSRNDYSVINSIGNSIITISGAYDLEACNCDYIYIRDGSGTSGAILATYTNGSGVINYSGTAGQTLTIQFTSDGSVVSRGFSLNATYSGACVYNYVSSWQSMNLGSANWCAGETRNVTVTVKNNGGLAWTDASPDINIGCKWDADADYFVRVHAGNLAAGATQTYTFTMTAPATAGTNHLTFDIVNEGNCWFGNNNGSCGPGNVVYTSSALTIDGTAPSQDAVSVNSNCWITDNAHNYTITLSATESGVGIGGTYGMLALINYQGESAGSYGGYFAWNPSQAALNASGYTADQQACTGGGWVGKYAGGYGNSVITLVSASTSVSGNQRTVVFTVRPNSSFPQLADNDVSMYTTDACNNANGWTNWQTNFSSGSSSLGTASTLGPIDFCDASGNFTTAVTVSGAVGTIVWDWGSNNGVWNNNWVTGNSSGVCCFPKQVSVSDGTADRMRYRVTNGNCPTVTSSTILVRDRWNEAPSGLVSSGNYIGNGTSVTLTASFPSTVNLRGTVDFFAGSCGGTPIASVAGTGGTTVSASVTPPLGTTTYYARYNPGTGTGCSVSACTSIEIWSVPNFTGLMVSGDFTNNGTLDMTSDVNDMVLIGSGKKIDGTGIYTNANIQAYSLGVVPIIYFNGIMTGNANTKVGLATFEINAGKTYLSRNMTINNGTTLSFKANSIVECTGDWTNNGIMSYADNTPIVKFSAAGTSQTIKLNSPNNYEFKNVVFNNKTGGNVPGHFTLTDSLIIANSATFTYGIVKTVASTAGTYVVFKDNATAAGYNNNSFIRGKIRKWGNDNFTFPTGFFRGTTSRCNPIQINNTAGAVADWYTAEYVCKWTSGNTQIWTDSAALSISGIAPANMDAASSPVLNHVSKQEFWEVMKKGTSSYLPVTIYSNDLVFSGITQADIADVQVAHYKTSNSKWENMTGSFVITDATGNGKGYITSVTNFSTYSPITFGSKTAKNPLPVELISFNAHCDESSILIDWSTLTEINSNYFKIEKSYDAEKWFELAEIGAKGNSNQLQEYQYIDNSEFDNAVKYYRLTEVDLDGKTTEFSYISVSCKDDISPLVYSIYPIPAKDILYLKIISADRISASIIITNELGQKVEVKDLFIEMGNNEYKINTSKFTSGVYFISIQSQNKLYPFKRFVVSH